jgi:type I restriction enzyme S subunit
MNEVQRIESKEPPNLECPRSWALTRLADIAYVQLGKTPGKEDYRNTGSQKIVKYRDLGSDGRIVWTNSEKGFVDPARARVMNLRPLLDGDILISASAHSSEIIGRKVLHVTSLPDEFDAVYLVGEILCIRVVANEAPDLAKVVSYFFRSLNGYKAIQAKVHGVHLIASRAEEMVVPIPPPNMQSRMVDKIEELFSRIEEGERALERAQKLVERCRQSVLKAAVTGELTREWREQREGQLESGEALLARILKTRREAWEQAELDKTKGILPTNDKWKQRYPKPAAPDTTYQTELPASWTWASVQQAGDVRLGRQRAPQHHSGDHMRPYLRVANVYEDCLDLVDVKQMNFTPDEFNTYALRVGDILLNEGQSPELVGRPAMYRGEIPGCCYQKTLLRFRTHRGIRPEFALLVFRAHLHSGRFRRSANITTSIAHLAAERFVAIEFPIPSEEEQAQIVDVATSKLSVLAHLEADLVAQQMAAQRLRQSVLKAAFSGVLVDHLATDEPAAVLLAKIATERRRANAVSGGTRKSGARRAA